MIVDIYALKPKKTWYPLIISWIIMFLQKTKWSHMAMGYVSMTGSYKMIDSRWPNGVTESLFFRFFKKYTEVKKVSIEIDCDKLIFHSWVENQEGKSYPFSQLLTLVPKIIGITRKNSHGRDFNAMICNELVLLLLKEFKGAPIGDPDNYDLNMTWDLVSRYKIENLDSN